ncbi:MAG: YceI family protein [Bdellovibrionales bacterium]|nr:YceI family protein [Bdellovibrionales bacterium]
MKKYLGLFILFLFLGTNAFTKDFELIKEHSKIGFDVDYMLMTKVEGQFKNFQGFFTLNEKENDISNIKIIAESESVDTNDGKRDFHLRGHEFFFSANYPQITFESPGPIKLEAGKKIVIGGYLTMRGIKRPLILEGIYKGKLKDPWGKENYFFTLSGELDRKTFGIVWNKSMDDGGILIGDAVRLSLTVQAQVLGGKTPFSTHMVPTTKGIVERDLLNKGKIKKLSTSTDPKDKTPKEKK